MEVADGVTVSETSTGGPTVNAPDPLTPAEVAMMFAPPIPIPPARPVLPTSATVCVSEIQVAEAVRS
jgi:hypothetical protein